MKNIKIYNKLNVNTLKALYNKINIYKLKNVYDNYELENVCKELKNVYAKLKEF